MHLIFQLSEPDSSSAYVALQESIADAVGQLSIVISINTVFSDVAFQQLFYVIGMYA